MVLLQRIGLIVSLATSLSSASYAEEMPRIDVIDFVVDWQTYVGKAVILTGGAVNFADSTSAVLFKPGAAIMLLAPYREKEDMRYILKNCAGVAPAALCAMEVSGVVDSKMIGDDPVLRDVDFAATSQ